MPLFYYHVSHITVMMRHKLAEKQRYWHIFELWCHGYHAPCS